MKLFLFIAMILIASEVAEAQNAIIRFDQIGLAQGLSQSGVNTIIQDNPGFMWFGTQDGLNCFDGYNIKVFKHDPSDSNSISDNTIWSLLPDPKGNLWIGTEKGGLDKYMPSENRFYHFINKPEDSTSINGNHVTTLFQDSYANIWVGTDKGLDLLNVSAGIFTHIIFNDSTTFNNIKSLCQDHSGNLWIASTKGLYEIRKGYNEIVNSANAANMIRQYIINCSREASGVTGPGSDDILFVYEDHKENLWVGINNKGIFRYDRNAKLFLNGRGRSGQTYSLTGKFIKSIFEDSEGLLWVGTFDGGLDLYNDQTGNFETQMDESVLSIYEDRSGILWIGTWASGIRMFDRRRNKFVHYYDDPDKKDDLSGNVVSSIIEDIDGELWVGTWGNGLNRFNKKRDKITYYSFGPHQQNPGSNLIFSLCETPDGSIWVGTQSGGLLRYIKRSNKFIQYLHKPGNKNSLSYNDVTRMCFDKKKNVLWIGYWEGGISSYEIGADKFTHYLPAKNNPESISGSAVTTIYKGNKTGLWIGTARRGIDNLIPGSSTFQKFLIPETVRKNTAISSSVKGDNISNNGILSVYEDKNGIVWIGTSGGGLDSYNPASGTFTFYTTRNGLPNDFVYGILPDRQGNLWLSTNKGLSRFNSKSIKFRNFDVNDGLQSNEFNEGAYFGSNNGELFFGGMNGFNSFYPEQIINNEYIPPVYITSFKVFDNEISYSGPIINNSSIKLSNNQNFFSFEFVALNFSSPEKNQYKYMLEGFDKQWHTVSSSRRYASYTNLDPGTYTIRVKASNNDGVWNDKGASVILLITPPFWMTWWFRILFASAVIGIIFLIYKYRVAQLLKIERMRFQIATDLHDDVGTSLTGIALYSDLAKVEIRNNSQKAEHRLDNIAELSRSLLDRMNDIVWFIKPENDSLQSAILRMSDTATGLFEAKGIEHRMNIQGEISNVNLSMDQRRNLLLIFKEMLNNVIKHSGANRVNISVNIAGKKNETEGIRINIDDNGCGFDADKIYKGNGLKNIRDRARHIGADFVVNSAPGQGTSITLFAPFKIT